jgi:hypothetical protein
MAEVSAGDIVGRLKVNTDDLARLRSEAARTGQALKAELGQKIQFGDNYFDKLKASATQAQAAISATNAAARNSQTLFSASAAKLSGGDTDHAAFVRGEKARADALIASRTAWKDFETSIRGGSANVTNSLQSANAASASLSAGFANLRSVAAGLGITLGVAGFVSFVTSAATAVARLQDLSDQTGIAASKLAAIKPIVENAGSSIEEFATGIRTLQRQMVEGAPDTIAAMKDLGISVTDMLRFSADPEGAIDALTKGLSNIENQGKSTSVALEVLSRVGFRLAPALKEIGRAGGIQKLEITISDSDIAKLDKALDNINKLKIQTQNFTAIKFNDLIDQFKEIGQIWTELYNHPFRFLMQGGLLGFSKRQAAAGEQANRTEAAEALDAERGSQTSRASGVIGLAELKSQTEFKKALDEQIQSLQAQKLALTDSGEAAIAMAAGIIQAKAETIGLSKNNADLVKLLDQFKTKSLEIKQAQLADSFIQQNRAIEANIASMTQSRAAAEELGIRNTLLAAKLNNVGEAAIKAAENQRQLNTEQARAAVPQALRDLDDARATAQRKQITLGITFNADEAIRQAVEQAIEKLVSNPDPRVKALALEAAIKLKPELDESRLAAIKSDLGIKLGLDAEFGNVLNKTFANTFDQAGAKVDALTAALQRAKAAGADPLDAAVQKMGADLDRARLDQAVGNIARDLTIAASEAQVFGRSFDLGSANIQAIQTQIQNLLRQGLSPANAEVQRLKAQLESAKVADVFSDLAKDMQDAARQAEVLGGAVDLPAETINKLTEAIKRLLAEGLDPLNPKIQELKSQLEDAKAAQRWTEAFQGMASAFSDAINEIASNPKGWKDSLKKLAQRINSELTQALVTKPLEEWIKKQANEIFGKIFPQATIPGGTKPGGVGGAAATPDQAAIAAIQAEAATSQAAMQALSAEVSATIQGQSATADATIQALSAEAMAALQAESATAQTSFQAIAIEGQAALQAAAAAGQSSIAGTAATAQGAIEAVKEVAIAAIEAVKTGGGAPVPGPPAPGGPMIPFNLFGGSAAPDAGPMSAGGGLVTGMGYAQGGHMWAGDVGIVGERGREIWKPDRAGSVIPLQKMMQRGGVNVVNHFHNPQFADRTSEGQIYARIGNSVQQAHRNS